MSTKESCNYNLQGKNTDDLPPVVYLDSQDYSRFGDVLRGKSDEATEKLFKYLEGRKQAGDVIFAISLPILSEVLQYDICFRETALKKAEAIERLCDGWALAYPSRLVAAEVAIVARRLNLTSELPYPTILSADWHWYPNIAHCFEDLNEKMQDTLKSELHSLGLMNRKQRRIAKKEIQKIGFGTLTENAAPIICQEYGFPIELIIESLAKFLHGKITPNEASRKLFSEVGKPSKFIELYFEKIDSDKSLPKWIRNFGDNLASAVIEFRDQISKLDLNKKQINEFLKTHQRTFGRSVLALAHDAAREFQIGKFLNDKFLKDPLFATQIPSINVVGTATEVYIGQIIGLYGNKFKVENSFGGDLFHSLYLPHVDLWRSDKRFACALQSAMPQYANRIVPRLTELPAAIDKLLLEISFNRD